MADQTESPEKQQKVEIKKQSVDPVRVWTFIVLGMVIVLLAWYLRADRVTPYTSQARFHMVVIPIAPEVSGLITSVAVKNNQFVKAGDELFQIDKHNYELAVRIAEAQLEAARQVVGASGALVDAAKAAVGSAKGNLLRADQDLSRMRKIRRENAGAISIRRLEAAEASFSSAEGALAASEANLQQALQNYGSEGDRNSRILQAQANLDHTNHDLHLTTLHAPGDGIVTGVELDKGKFASKGQPQMTFIAIRNYWVQADFTENNLAHIKPGDQVDIVFDVYPGQIFKGTVREMGYGVAVSTTPPGGLPQIKNNREWLRDAQRFPVLIDVEVPNEDANRIVKIGAQATVITYTGDHRLLNALAKFYIRLVSIMTYAY